MLSEFDRICEAILDAVNSKIDYDNPNRARDILYSMLIAKQLLKLPLSTHVQRKIEGSIRNDRGILYKGFEPPSDLDVTECWFAEGEVADPDASLLFPYHKITHREVHVDAFQCSAGIRVSYESRQVLVPRSARARAVHEGKPLSKTPSARAKQKGTTLFSVPSALSVPPFQLSRKEQANSILDVLEYCGKQWKGACKHLAEGSLADWFKQRGQTALATQLRRYAKTKPDAKEVLAVLQAAATAEVDDAILMAKQEADRLVKDKQAEADGQRRAVEAKRDAELRAYDEPVVSRKTELEDQVKKTQTECTSKCQEERRKTDVAVEKERAAVAEAIKQAEDKRERRLARHQGVRGFLRWQLPFGVLGAGCGVAAGQFIPPEVLARVQGLPPEITPEIFAAVVGGAACAGVGLLGASILKSIARFMVKWPAVSLKRGRDNRCDRLSTSCKARVAKIEKTANSKTSPLEAELEKITRGREPILRRAEEQLRQIRERYEVTVQGFRETSSKTTQDLEQRLSAGLCFTVKPEGDSAKFPAVAKATSNGYGTGNEPPSSEMQMTYSEEQEARSQLQMAMLLKGRF